MPGPRHDRIFPLTHLRSFPGREYFDSVFFLPPADDPERRVWLMAPDSSPELSTNSVQLKPIGTAPGKPRWVDYGVHELPLGFSQLRVKGIRLHECPRAYLLVSSQVDFRPDHCTLDRAERKLWGLARVDAGHTRLEPARVRVGEPVSFTVTYTNGPKILTPGALVRFSVPGRFARPQTEDEDAPGYTRILKCDATAEVTHIGRSTESHQDTEIVCTLRSRLRPEGTLKLEYSTPHTYLFPCSFDGADRPFWYTKVPPLTTAVTAGPNSPFVCLADANAHSLDIVQTDAERLHLLLPGRRYRWEPVSVRGVFTDRYRNVAPTGPIPDDIDVYVVSEAGERTPVGDIVGRFADRHRFALQLPRLQAGIYRAEAVWRGSGEVIARSNPMELLDQDDDRPRIYWGEIHGHTEMSDGMGDLRELYRHAREEGALDFAAAADHAEYVSDNDWAWMQETANDVNAPGWFLTLNGYEWGGRQVHRNVYSSEAELPLLRGTEDPEGNLKALWERFEGQRNVVLGIHPASQDGTAWKDHNGDLERFVELFGLWATRDTDSGPEDAEQRWLDDLLAEGAALGLTGGGDCHQGVVGFAVEPPLSSQEQPHVQKHGQLLYRSGLTAALLPQLDRESLITALRERQTYATTGARILLDFGIGELTMGQRGPVDDAECLVLVHAEKAISRIEIIRDGSVAWSCEPEEPDAAVSWTDPEPPEGASYYYLRVIQKDGHVAWSSPIWVEPRD